MRSVSVISSHICNGPLFLTPANALHLKDGTTPTFPPRCSVLLISTVVDRGLLKRSICTVALLVSFPSASRTAISQSPYDYSSIISGLCTFSILASSVNKEAHFAFLTVAGLGEYVRIRTWH